MNGRRSLNNRMKSVRGRTVPEGMPTQSAQLSLGLENLPIHIAKKGRPGDKGKTGACTSKPTTTKKKKLERGEKESTIMGRPKRREARMIFELTTSHIQPC